MRPMQPIWDAYRGAKWDASKNLIAYIYIYISEQDHKQKCSDPELKQWN